MSGEATAASRPARGSLIRWSIAVIIALVALATGWLVITGVMARSNAEDLQADVRTMRQSLETGDLPAARAAVDSAVQNAHSVESLTGGPLWWVVERAPVIGGDVTTARVVARTVIDLAETAQPLLAIVEQWQVSGGRTPAGRLDLQALQAASPAMTSTSDAARAAATRLEGLPAADSGEAQVIGEVIPLLDRAADLLERGAEGVALLPAMLGADGPRTWAVLLQNTAEIRGSGGLVGAYALVTADDGRIELEEAAARKDGLDSRVIPADTVTDEGQEQTWGSDLTRWSDYNLSLDFPLTARLTAAGMAERGTPVDGVVALDARVVAALLAGTGPVESGGARIDSANAESFFTKDVYAKVPDVGQKDALTVSLLRGTLDAALGGDLNLVYLLRGLVDPVTEGRLRVWSADPAEEDWLVSSPLGGALDPAPGPFVGVALNNSAGSKLDAYLSLGAHYRVGSCPAVAKQDSTLEVSLLNDSPTGLPDYVDLRLDRPKAPGGSTSLLVHVYGPVGALLKQARLDGARQYFTATEEGGHPVWGFDVELLRGQERTLRLRITEPTSTARPRLILPNLSETVRGRVTERPATACSSE